MTLETARKLAIVIDCFFEIDKAPYEMKALTEYFERGGIMFSIESKEPEDNEYKRNEYKFSLGRKNWLTWLENISSPNLTDEEKTYVESTIVKALNVIEKYDDKNVNDLKDIICTCMDNADLDDYAGVAIVTPINEIDNVVIFTFIGTGSYHCNALFFLNGAVVNPLDFPVYFNLSDDDTGNVAPDNETASKMTKIIREAVGKYFGYFENDEEENESTEE